MVGKRNLTPNRGPNVWNREDTPEPEASKSRWLMGMSGAALALTGAALAAVGGTMVYRASLSGGPGGSEADRTPAGSAGAGRGADIVADESDASFPASDAPSWTPTVGPIADNVPGR